MAMGCNLHPPVAARILRYASPAGALFSCGGDFSPSRFVPSMAARREHANEFKKAATAAAGSLCRLRDVVYSICKNVCQHGYSPQIDIDSAYMLDALRRPR